MPIIPCPSCGAQLRVPDGAEGRKAKCNKCPTVFVIPPASTMQQTPQQPGPAPNMAPGAQPYPQQQVPGGYPQQTTPGYPPQQAPGGYPQQQVPGGYPPQQPAGEYPQQTAPGYPPQQAPAAQGGNFDFDDSNQRSRRRAKKKNAGGMPMIAIILLAVGGVALLAVGGIVGFMFFLGGGGSQDLTYMPDNITSIRYMNVAQLRSSALYKEYAEDEEDNINRLEDACDDRLGIDLYEISTVTMGGTKSSGTIAVVRTSANVNADDILDNRNMNDPEKDKVNGHIIYSVKSRFSKNRSKCFCVVNSRLVLYGNHDLLEEVLEAKSRPKFRKDMEAGLREFGLNGTQSSVYTSSGFGNMQYRASRTNISTVIQGRQISAFDDPEDAEDVLEKIEDNKFKRPDNYNISQSGSRLIITFSDDDSDHLGGLITSFRYGIQSAAR